MAVLLITVTLGWIPENNEVNILKYYKDVIKSTIKVHTHSREPGVQGINFR